MISKKQLTSALRGMIISLRFGRASQAGRYLLNFGSNTSDPEKRP